MDIRKLQRVIVDGLEDVKAQNIVVFNTEHLSALFERVIIASGTSNRQTKALASSVRDAVKGAGFGVPRTEGEVNGEWIVVDCGAAVVHVMQPTIREYYHLEEIWGDKPVKMKIDGVARKLAKAAELEPAVEAVVRKASARKAPAGTDATAAKVAGTTVPAKKLSSRKLSASQLLATRTPEKQASAKKVGVPKPTVRQAAQKKPVSRTTGVKRAAPRTIVVNSPDERKAVAKKAGAKAPASRKAPARKAAARAPATKS